MQVMPYLRLDDGALLKDLLDDILLLVGTELAVELAVGSSVQLTLVAVPMTIRVSLAGYGGVAGSVGEEELTCG